MNMQEPSSPNGISSVSQKALSQANKFWRSGFVYIALVALVIGFALINPKFFTIDNFSVIGRQTAITAVVAFGMTFVITAAEIDLSVGSIVGLVVMISTLVLEAGFGPVAGRLR